MRRAGKPPIIAANKVDSLQNTPLAAQFYGLGDQVFPISAEPVSYTHLDVYKRQGCSAREIGSQAGQILAVVPGGRESGSPLRLQ